MTTFPTKYIAISVSCKAEQAYAFISNPLNLPQWAAGLSGSIQNVKGEWIAESPMGKIKIQFAAKNSFGVLDHDVTLPSGEVVYNPMRVFPNNTGCEVVFTLLRRPEMTDKMFEEDENMVRKDLQTLKNLLEK